MQSYRVSSTNSAMNTHSLVYVDGDKVVVASFRTRILRRVQFRRASSDAENSLDVGFSVGSAEVAPELVQIPTLLEVW